MIAEGVETRGQEAVLQKLGCCEAQGFRYGRAAPIADIVERFLARDYLRPAELAG